MIGAVQGGGGALELAAGTGTLSGLGGILLCGDEAEACAFANEYAVEHLQIATADPGATLSRIDYAAPVGTPVWASSAGKVVECQMKRGSGNTVVLAHANGLATRYYHLSRFARGLKVGKLVRQKEVIGFVGTTGLSTGPHLHFSVTQNGAFVDPGKLKMNRDAPVPDRGAYLGAVRERMAVLRQLQPTALARN